MSQASRSPLGVIADPAEAGQLICYGTIAGELKAIRFGTGELLPLTPVLLALIQDDQSRSRF